jgi:hypothetical protein
MPDWASALAHSQESRARFEEAPATLLSPARRLFLERLQIRQIGKAKSATDGLQVEFDVVVLAAIKYLQEIIAQEFAAWTRQTAAAPDSPDAVLAPIALLHHAAQLHPEHVGLAERLLHVGRFAVTQGVIQVRGQLLTRKGRHAHIPSTKMDEVVTIIAECGKTRER